MQKLALLMIVGVAVVPYLTAGDYWHRMAILPGPAKYTPELLGAAALLIVLAFGIRDRFRFVRPAYWVIFGLLAISLAAGCVSNKVEPGPLFSGLRAYLRAIPWFLLPAVFAFTEKNLRTQLKWLLAISLLQLPIAIEQRILTGNNYYGFVAVTGDMTTGTFGYSGNLSIFLASAACVVAALTLKRLLPKWQGLLLALVLLVPTMINETKVTLIIVPLALFVTFQVLSKRGQRLKQLVMAVAALAVFLAAFVPIYNWLQEDRPKEAGGNETVGDFFFSDKAQSYVETDAEIGTTGYVGRVDSIRVAVQETLSDPIRTVFGLGIGNTMESALGPQFSGKYFERYSMFTKETSFSTIFLELGFLGFSALMCVYWLIVRDALFVAGHSTPYMSALAAAWVAITAMMALMLFYSAIHVSVALSFLFWYFSGIVAAERARLVVSVSSARTYRVPSAGSSVSLQSASLTTQWRRHVG
jgi:hypothetical protein